MITLDHCEEQKSDLFDRRRMTRYFVLFLTLVFASGSCLMTGCGEGQPPKQVTKKKKKKKKKPLTHTARPDDKPFLGRGRSASKEQQAQKIREMRSGLSNGSFADLAKELDDKDDSDKDDSDKDDSDKDDSGKESAKDKEAKKADKPSDDDKKGDAKLDNVSGIDDAKLDKVGIRKLSSKHLTLYTDVPSSASVDELPRIFDLAVPKWCEYFKVEPAVVARWHVVGCLIKDKDLFKSSGLMAANLPPFTFGYAKSDRIWLYEIEKTSDYYRRHLMLHEGTHAIMFALFQRAGAPWFKEGIAELMATHYWNDEEEAENDKLTLRYFPDYVEDFPKLGRIKIIQDAVSAGRGVDWNDVMDLPNQAFLKNDAYAWSWALLAFFDGAPKYRDAFVRIRDTVKEEIEDERFTTRARRHYLEGMTAYLSDEWQVYLAEMEHNYDLNRMAIDFALAPRMNRQPAEVDVEASYGWQNSGLGLVVGRTYTVSASGRVQLAQEPKTWWSEPNGVSIRYHMGKPRGLLMAAIRPKFVPIGSESVFLKPIVIGKGKEFKAEATGTLFLRINDSPGELYDNDGTYHVRIEPKAS